MKKTIIFLEFLMISVMLLGIQAKLLAHCDTLEGPVIKDAKAALETKDVTPVLKWVSKEHEGEVKTAFDNALKERAQDKEKTDMGFFELLVRIHRKGEGASFTGLKPAGAVEPIVAEADKALQIGSVDTLTTEMSEHLTSEVKERFERALEKKKHVNESVDAGREYVEAYIEYVHYVEGLHKAVVSKDGHQHEESEEGEQESRDAK